MKFSCDKNQLNDMITMVSRAVSTKTTMPLLEGILIEATLENLTFTGYNLSMAIRTTTSDVDLIEDGRIVLNAKLFGDIVRKLPSDLVYLECDSELRTTIKCGRAVFNLIANAADEYPTLPEVEKEREIQIPSATLKSMIAQTIFAVSENEAKPIHTGCLFETEGTRLNVIAVDGYRLSVRREELPDAPEANFKFVVPGSSLREIERVLNENDDPISIFPGDKHILFLIGDTTMISRLIDGEFLNYRAAIPTNFEHVVKVDRSDLITCVERVSLIVSEKLKNPVRMSFDGDTVKMSCITAIGKSYDECAIDGSIQDLEIGFNNRYLLDALRAAVGDTVQISLKGALNPMVITPLEGDSYTYLVLPVRLKANE